MTQFNAEETLTLMVDLGKQRASKSTEIVLDGSQVEDYFVHEASGIAIHDPWHSSCGRFEVEPFVIYGRPFIEWLMRPFYDDAKGIIRRINEDKPAQGASNG